MSAIVVRSEFWNNPIIQFLRNIVPKTVTFRESKGISVDILVPFCNSISFYFVDTSSIDSSTFVYLNRIVSSFKSTVVIAKVEERNMNNYISLLSNAPKSISCITYFNTKGFEKASANFVFEIIENSQRAQRNISSMIEERRRNLMNPTETAKFVITNVIQDEEKRKEIFNILSQKGMTLRTSLLKGVPELFQYNFFLQPSLNNN